MLIKKGERPGGVAAFGRSTLKLSISAKVNPCLKFEQIHAPNNQALHFEK